MVDSFESVFLAEYGPLVRLATAVCGAPARAEEVVQDAFTSALPRWPGIRDPRAFLHRSVVNGAIDAGRRRDRSDAAIADESVLRDIDAAIPDPEPADESLWALLDSLPAAQRAVIALRFQADLPLARSARCSAAR